MLLLHLKSQHQQHHCLLTNLTTKEIHGIRNSYPLYLRWPMEVSIINNNNNKLNNHQNWTLGNTKIKHIPYQIIIYLSTGMTIGMLLIVPFSLIAAMVLLVMEEGFLLDHLISTLLMHLLFQQEYFHLVSQEDFKQQTTVLTVKGTIKKIMSQENHIIQNMISRSTRRHIQKTFHQTITTNININGL